MVRRSQKLQSDWSNAQNERRDTHVSCMFSSPFFYIISGLESYVMLYYCTGVEDFQADVVQKLRKRFRDALWKCLLCAQFNQKCGKKARNCI